MENSLNNNSYYFLGSYYYYYCCCCCCCCCYICSILEMQLQCVLEVLEDCQMQDYTSEGLLLCPLCVCMCGVPYVIKWSI